MGAPERSSRKLAGELVRDVEYPNGIRPAGQRIVTSRIVGVCGRLIQTHSRTYELVGGPTEQYARWCAENGIDHDPMQPIRMVRHLLMSGNGTIRVPREFWSLIGDHARNEFSPELVQAFGQDGYWRCVSAALTCPDLIVEFDRLYGCNLQGRGTPLELEIDRVSGRAEVEVFKFLEFCYEAIYSRLPPTTWKSAP